MSDKCPYCKARQNRPTAFPEEFVCSTRKTDIKGDLVWVQGVHCRDRQIAALGAELESEREGRRVALERIQRVATELGVAQAELEQAKADRDALAGQVETVREESETLRKNLADALKVLATVEHTYPGRFKTGLPLSPQTQEGL